MKSKSWWLSTHTASCNGGASRLNCGGQAWPVGLRRSNTCGGELRVLASLAMEGIAGDRAALTVVSYGYGEKWKRG